MSKTIDLTSQRFGKLVAIERKENKNKRAMWKCQCDCGNIVVVSSDKLKSGHTKSCGCLRAEKASEKAVDLTGQEFERWTVLELAYKKGSEYFWRCKCECGSIKNIRTSSLKSGNSKSCGCLAREITSKRTKENYKPKPIIDMVGEKYGKLTVVKIQDHIKGNHVKWLCQCDCGGTRITTRSDLLYGKVKDCGCSKLFSYRTAYPRIYGIWQGMKDRCLNENNPRYADYGGRNIGVFPEWINSFEIFCKWSLQNGYKDNLTIERMDVNGNYEPDNCMWITAFEQMSNMRKNVFVTYKGERNTISQWSRIYNIPRSTIAYRLKNGWTVEEALETRPIYAKKNKA